MKPSPLPALSLAARSMAERLTEARRDAEAGDRPRCGPSAIDAPAPTEVT